MVASTRALVVHGPDDLRLEDRSRREPGASEAVVAISYGGICGSDLHYWRDGRVGTSVLSEPMVLGHEVVGVVEEAAADGSGPAAGTPVFVHPAQTCGHCRYCLAGRPNLCVHLRYLGSAARLPHTSGAFADTVTVAADRLIPTDGLAPRDAALIEPASVAWHAVSRIEAAGGAIAGARIAVLGAGPIGLLAIAALIARGAAEVLATDLHERPLRLARSLGATTTVRADDSDALASWRPDHTVESSGSPALAGAVEITEPGGVVVAVGQPAAPSTLNTPRMVSGELVLTGSSRFADEPVEVIAALRDGRLDVSGIVSDEFTIDRYAEAFALAADSAASSKVLLRFGRPSD